MSASRGRRGAGEPIDPDLSPGDRSEPAVGRGLQPHQHRRRLDVLAVIAAGGMLGASARYAMSQAIHVPPGTFPWATFWTNIIGAFVLGLGLVLLLERLPDRPRLRLFFGTGIVGAFTTMSTFEVETVLLVKDGHAAIGAAYALASVAAGLAAALAGIRLARAAAPGRAPAGGSS